MAGLGDKISQAALRWLYEKDGVAYHLACASMLSTPKRKQRIIEVMSDEHRQLARAAMDGSWMRY